MQEDVERFGYSRSRHLVALDDSFVRFGTADNVVALYRKNLLKDVGCAESFERPNLHLSETLHIPLTDTMAFGDYLNDFELLSEAGLAYAMENGHPDLKRIADRIAPSNDQNGVVRAITAYFGL